MKDAGLNIWFISKYGGTPGNGNYMRNFFFCREFAAKKHNVYFFNSYYQFNTSRHKLKSFYNLVISDGVYNYQINGPRISNGFSYKRVYSWFVFEFNLLRLVLFNLREGRPDVVIVKSISLFSIISGLILKLRFKTKLVVEITDIWPKTLIEIGNYSTYNPLVFLLGLIEKIGYKYADALIGSMPNLKEHIQSILKYDKEVFYIPQGYSFFNSNTAISKKLDFSNTGVFTIIYAGTLGSANQIDDLVAVAKILDSRRVKCHFYFLGDGPLKLHYKNETAHLNNVSFLDPLPREQVSGFLSKFDLLIIAWKKSELYAYGISPNKLMDYMNSGRPILMSYSGFPSLFESDKYCFLVEAENVDQIASKIEEIICMPSSLLDSMGKSALETLHKFHSYELLAANYLDILRRVI